MRRYYSDNNGYLETIRKGLDGVRRFASHLTGGRGTREENIDRLRRELDTADAVVIGAGAGLSTAAGFTYSGARFERYFSDFGERFGISEMYSGGFYPFPSKESFWAYWARYIYINRYQSPPTPVYDDLKRLVDGKNYFVITTNVDHQFQRAGFDKSRLFYTQGDYGLFQSVDPSIKLTFDNEAWVMRAMEAQGFVKGADGAFAPPEDKSVLKTELPPELIPVCPLDGGEVTMNLRSDDSFVEDEGWHEASGRYAEFLREQEGRHVLFLEIGVGSNTPVIIKYPFWQMTDENPNAVYACLNYSEAFCPRRIEHRSICIEGDSGEVIRELANGMDA